ncbi:MAG TPA: hypothetical protein VGR00_14725 [Thermoanaerobaculia bacterium]|jgi:tetratricopeptide (TPR) repeat protein|nr:hypothetical protein [Thermoanaerobaculia bacterium]
MFLSTLGIAALLFMAPPVSQAPPASKAPPADDARKGSAHAGPAGLEVSWHTSLASAVEAARKAPEKRLLIEFMEDDCGDCARMESLIHPATSFFSLMQDKVAVRLSRATPEGRALAERLGVTRSPGWAIVTPDLLLCGYQDGPTSQTEWFEIFAKSEASWAEYRRLLDKEQKAPGDAALVYRVAVETFERRGDDIAEPRFRRLSKDASVSADVREKSLAYLASIELEQGRPVEAEMDLNALLAIAKDPAIRERAELHLVTVEIAKGRRDKAIARLRTFLASHPDSKLLDEARAVLKALAPADASIAR